MTVVKIKKQKAQKVYHKKKTEIWKLQKLSGSNSTW